MDFVSPRDLSSDIQTGFDSLQQTVQGTKDIAVALLSCLFELSFSRRTLCLCFAFTWYLDAFDLQHVPLVGCGFIKRPWLPSLEPGSGEFPRSATVYRALTGILDRSIFICVSRSRAGVAMRPKSSPRSSSAAGRSISEGQLSDSRVARPDTYLNVPQGATYLCFQQVYQLSSDDGLQARSLETASIR